MKEQIETFVAHCQTNIIDQADLTFNPKLEIEYGKKYARIVFKNSWVLDSGSAWGFIDLTNGDILKAAGWKAPAKNFARGNIYNDPETWNFEWTGIQ